MRVAPSRELDVRIAPSVGRRRVRISRRMPCARSPTHRHARTRARACPQTHSRRRRTRRGSSDAGAVLRGLARVWRLDGVNLTPAAARVGSDVPFFVSGAAYALVRGRGELVETLPAPEPVWIALVQLRAHASTAEVFGAYRGRPSKGERSEALAKALRDRKVTVAGMRDFIHNDLLDAAERIVPAIADARKTASAMGSISPCRAAVLALRAGR